MIQTSQYPDMDRSNVYKTELPDIPVARPVKEPLLDVPVTRPQKPGTIYKPYSRVEQPVVVAAPSEKPTPQQPTKSPKVTIRPSQQQMEANLLPVRPRRPSLWAQISPYHFPMMDGESLYAKVFGLFMSALILGVIIWIVLYLSGVIGDDNPPERPESGTPSDLLAYAQRTLLYETIENLKKKKLDHVTLAFCIILGILILLFLAVKAFALAEWAIEWLGFAIAAVAFPISIFFFVAASYWFGGVFLAIFVLFILYMWPHFAKWYKKMRALQKLKEEARSELEDYKKFYSDKDTKLFEEYISKGTKQSLSKLIEMFETERIQHGKREEMRDLARGAEAANSTSNSKETEQNI